MEIIITYRRRGATPVETLTLTPEEYFDPIEPGESYLTDAVPRLWHDHEYVDLSPDQLDWINVEYRDDDGAPAEIHLREYQADGRIMVQTCYGVAADGSRSWEDVVVETELKPKTFHQHRMYRDDPCGRWRMTLNGIVRLREGEPDECEDIYEGRPWGSPDDSP